MTLQRYQMLGVACAVCACAAAVIAAVLGGCDTPLETVSGGTARMACHYTFITEMLLEVLATAVLLGLAFVKCKVGRRWLAGCGIGAQVLCWLTAYTPLMGLCANMDMSCHVAATVCTVVQVVVVVLAAVAFGLADPKRAVRPKKEL